MFPISLCNSREAYLIASSNLSSSANELAQIVPDLEGLIHQFKVAQEIEGEADNTSTEDVDKNKSHDQSALKKDERKEELKESDDFGRY